MASTFNVFYYAFLLVVKGYAKKPPDKAVVSFIIKPRL